MHIDIDQQGHVSIVRPTGKLLIGDPEDLMNASVARLVDQGLVHLLIDLAGVTAMDSSGVDTLVRAWRLTHQRGGAMKLVNVPPRVKTLLELTGLSDVWEIHVDPQEAIFSFGSLDSRP